MSPVPHGHNGAGITRTTLMVITSQLGPPNAAILLFKVQGLCDELAAALPADMNG